MDTSCLWSSTCFPWAPINWAVGVSSQRMLTLFLLRLCSQKEEGEAMKEAAGERKKKRRGWGSLSGHHVDLIDHSRTWLVCIHTHTHTEPPNQYVTKEGGRMMERMEEGKRAVRTWKIHVKEAVFCCRWKQNSQTYLEKHKKNLLSVWNSSVRTVVTVKQCTVRRLLSRDLKTGRLVLKPKHHTELTC